MRRMCLVLALALFGAPLAQQHCVDLCSAAAPRPRGNAPCHDADSGAAPALTAAPHDCGSHVSLDEGVNTPKRAAAQPAETSLRLPYPPVLAPLVRAAAPVEREATGPPGSFSIPRRI